MLMRRLTAGAAALAVAATTWVGVSPAQADPTPAFVPAAHDIVGVGSDTVMYATNYLADGVWVDATGASVKPPEVDPEVHTFVPGFNEGRTSAVPRLASFDAYNQPNDGVVPLGCTTDNQPQAECAPIVLREGTAAIDRLTVNGSGNGKRALYGATNLPQVNFARTSAALSAAEAEHLTTFPLAYDGFKPAVRTAGTNAPAAISAAQFLSIYKGEILNWSQIGGAAGTIVPLVPQTGSGTYQEFDKSMTALNGGDPGWNTNPNAQNAQEHDDTLIKDNPNAIAPFSTGRAKAKPTVRIIENSWSHDRALYHAVRDGDLDAAFVADIFGPAGFICSPAAKPLIEASGFEQLASVADGGVCGVATKVAVSNFTTTPDGSDEEPVVTTTTLAGISPSAGAVRLTATIAPSSAAGTVEFTRGATSVGVAGVAGGQALLNLSGVAAGTHTYTATFTPGDDEAFTASTSASVSVTVVAPTSGPSAACVAAQNASTQAAAALKTAQSKLKKAVTKLKKAKQARKSAIKAGQQAKVAKATSKVKKLKKIVKKSKQTVTSAKSASSAAASAAADACK